MPQQCAHDRQQHANFARAHTTSRRDRRTQPLDGKNNAESGNDVRCLPKGIVHFPPVSFFLNILSIRSVIRNPATMLMVANATAMMPRILLTIGEPPLPETRIAPTTEIAEIALVNDIRGVCNRGDTRRTNSRPSGTPRTRTYR